MFQPSNADRLLIAARAAQQEGRNAEAAMLLDGLLRLEPNNPMAHTVLAELAVGRHDYAEAIRQLDLALSHEAQFAPAWCIRARALWFSGRHTESLDAARRAHAIQPAHPQYTIQHAQLAGWMGYRQEAQAAIAPLLQVPDPAPADLADAMSTLGEIALADGRSEDAGSLLSKALALDHDRPVTRMMLGMNQLKRGLFEPGWANYAAREAIRHFYPNGPAQLPGAVWSGQSLTGRSIIVIDDQGHGDSIQFFRLLPRLLELGAARVTLLTFPGLERLFRQAAKGTAITVLVNLPNGTQADYHCSSTALLRWLGVTLESIPQWRPYLFPPAAASIRLPKRSGPQVGLAWSGDPMHTRDHLRSIPATRFLRLAEVPGITFHSLQKVVRPSDEPALARYRGLGRAVEDGLDFADTAALIDRLDLVIAVDTGVAHLAAAMGKPVWMLVHAIADWRWLEVREDSPWYPTLRLFRGRNEEWRDGDMGWEPLIDRVATALRTAFPGRRRANWPRASRARVSEARVGGA